ncbi:UDP-N-acetylmuramoyl-L-alanine--D-glutamate ligase [Candidatus Peribacteria bacterium]|nr:UDP-N-acetylmuramoyl-L-alanine--D-glutamate ligase [Candidatus Peribacteria bacterium]MBT4240450.1 UDP-N-acetylmuramoyl-L-alanine--D-glutamate ligase [Candidatus Peribacteria bacterium]MBT4474532.1 UDP-N-acetylmuramoyl-L-alanine--D-glutamate ligase [Candidatus Peribacteria bacterium]
MQSNLRKLNGTVGILGFGVDGKEVCEFLEGIDEVEKVIIFDDSEPRTADRGPQQYGQSLDGIDLLFRSPGFPITHSLVKEAKEKNIPITSSTEFFLQNFPGVTIGITGSNGKTTCTALITEMLKAEFGDENVERGGNDGVPRLDLLLSSPALLDRAPKTARVERLPLDVRDGRTLEESTNFVVLELSSFQLIDSDATPDVSVVLNITPNHLDWHKDMDEYVNAKKKIVKNTEHGSRNTDRGYGVAVLNQDDPIVKKFSEDTDREVVWFGNKSPINADCLKTHPSTLSAAVKAARALNVSEENIKKVLQTFPGVKHRLQFIREIDGVKYYNDSSCTTPESAIAACNAFPEGSLILLMGGRDKGMDFSKLYEVIKERKVRVVPYGEMGEEFKKNLPDNCSFSTIHYSLQDAIVDARQEASSGDNVALSPACASFDMFKNAKKRGEEFTEIVEGV